MLGFILGLIIVGLIAGALARLLVPGRDPMGIGATILLGIVGSFVGGFLADVLFRSDSEDLGIHPVGIIGSVLGAIVVLLIYRAIQSRRGVRVVALASHHQGWGDRPHTLKGVCGRVVSSSSVTQLVDWLRVDEVVAPELPRQLERGSRAGAVRGGGHPGRNPPAGRDAVGTGAVVVDRPVVGAPADQRPGRVVARTSRLRRPRRPPPLPGAGRRLLRVAPAPHRAPAVVPGARRRGPAGAGRPLGPVGGSRRRGAGDGDHRDRRRQRRRRPAPRPHAGGAGLRRGPGPVARPGGRRPVRRAPPAPPGRRPATCACTRSDPRVNSVAHDGPDLLDEVEEPASLF